MEAAGRTQQRCSDVVRVVLLGASIGVIVEIAARATRNTVANDGGESGTASRFGDVGGGRLDARIPIQ